MFEFIERPSESDPTTDLDFYSFNSDYFGDVHLRRHTSQRSDSPQLSTASQEMFTFDNQVRVSTITKSQIDPHNIILGDIEGNLKLLRLEEKFKDNNLQVKLIPMIHSDNVTNFKRVNDFSWISNTELLVLGNDNSINLVDSSTLQPCFRINTKHSTPLKSAAHPLAPSTVIAGFEDGYIKMFDLRKNNRKAERFFKSHLNGISQLVADPIRSDLFLSAGFDGKVKVWDFRSDIPLYSIDLASNSKILALQWVDQLRFFSAGDDTRLTLHSLTADN